MVQHLILPRASNQESAISFTPPYYLVQNYYLDKSIPFEVRFSPILEQHVPTYAEVPTPPKSG